MPTSDNKSFGIDALIEHQFNDWLTARLKAGHFDADDTGFGSSIIPGFGRYDFALDQDITLTDVGADLIAEFEGDSIGQTLVLSVDYTKTVPEFIAFDPPRFEVVPFSAPYVLSLETPVDGKYYVSNFSLQDQITFNDRLHILIGGTISDFDLDYELPTFGTKFDINETEFSGKIGAAYDLTEIFSPFVGYSSGYKLPSPTVARLLMQPKLEKTEQMEIGLRFNVKDIGLSGSIAAYRINVTDGSESTGFVAFQVDQESQGFEADLLWKPFENLSLMGSYGYVDAQVDDSGSALDGNELLRVPEHSGRVAARYDFLDGALQGFGLGVGLTTSSKRAGDLGNNFFTESYEVVDAQASYRRERFEVNVGIENLFDSDYFVPNLFGDGNVGVSEPFTVTASVKVRY